MSPKIFEKLRDDPEIREMYSRIEYGIFEYNLSFHKSAEEAVVDKMLQCYTYVCYLKLSDLISEDEFLLVKYELVRVLTNSDIQDYLFNLYHFTKRVVGLDNKAFTFFYLLEYGRGEGLINEDFFDRNSANYKHCVNI